jgi:diphthine synthase
LGELVLIGLGLYNENDLTLRGIREAKSADEVFAEFYTSLMPGLALSNLESVIGRKIMVLSRKDLEEDCGEKILAIAKNGKAALLIPGDPLVATTHVELCVRAIKEGIKTRIVHNASIISAIAGICGLQNYKFGRSVSIPFPHGEILSETPYEVIKQNQQFGLHTLCFLDINAEEKRYMSINEGLAILSKIELNRGEKVITADTLAVGIARAGCPDEIVKADFVNKLSSLNFGQPPHCLVFPGKLHFMEAEALIVLCNAPESIMELTLQ